MHHVHHAKVRTVFNGLLLGDLSLQLVLVFDLWCRSTLSITTEGYTDRLLQRCLGFLESLEARLHQPDNNNVSKTAIMPARTLSSAGEASRPRQSCGSSWQTDDQRS